MDWINNWHPRAEDIDSQYKVWLRSVGQRLTYPYIHWHPEQPEGKAAAEPGEPGNHWQRATGRLKQNSAQVWQAPAEGYC